jgi:hypothetical protein
LLNSRELSAVPIARYFIVVGSALAVLLLIVGWSLPELPESFPDRPEIIERAAIRIRSERKWPEKIVLDTTQLTIPTPSIEVVPIDQLVARQPDEMTEETRVDPLPKPKPKPKPKPDVRSIEAHRRPAQAKRKPARAFPSAHVARTRNRNEPPTSGPSEECCRFEWANRPAVSRAALRKRVARRDPWIGWHFPEAN